MTTPADKEKEMPGRDDDDDDDIFQRIRNQQPCGNIGVLVNILEDWNDYIYVMDNQQKELKRIKKLLKKKLGPYNYCEDYSEYEESESLDSNHTENKKLGEAEDDDDILIPGINVSNEL